MKMRQRETGGCAKIIKITTLLILLLSMILKTEGAIAAGSATVYVVPAITDTKILPTSAISPSYISDTVSIKASPGESKAASFAVHADQNIDSLTVEVSSLTDNGNTIPSSNIDIKAVKCWYQGNSSSSSVGIAGRFLTPELLLKDDSLVSVDGNDWNQWNVTNPDGKNYLKVNGSYIDISSDTQQSHAVLTPNADRPIADASTLQPVNISAGYNKQFWITLKVPDGSAAGIYTGTITLRSGSQTIKQLQLKLQVLSITLLEPNIEYSVYYRGYISSNGTISSENKTMQQFTAEMKDMMDHGVTNPTVYSGTNLQNTLSIRNQAGMNGTGLYFLGMGIGSPNSVPGYKNIAAPYGVTDLYVYAPDEQDLNTIDTRAQIDAIHNAGGKVMDAQSLSYADSMADILDLAVVSGSPSATLADKYHSYGHKIYSYANPQVVPEFSNTFRKNFGLLLWQANYDGAMDYAYQHSAGDIWNDFDYGMRDHVFAYPTVDGVIDTVEWEGFREGVNDMRYLATLQNAITVAKGQSKDTAEAENYLANLKTSNLANQDLNTVRSQITNYILTLTMPLRVLTINSGTGAGSYSEGTTQNISASAPLAGMVFDKWTGDTSFVDNINLADTNVTMPPRNISLTATYKNIFSSWYDTGYSYRKNIVIYHSIAASNQAGFPVSISLTDAGLSNISKGGKVQNSNGYDIIFVLADGTRLNHEMESYDSDTGKLVAWVKVPTLSASVDTVIYMYYGNSAITTSQENKNGVWDDNYKMVQHMNQNPAGAVPQMKDSTQFGNDATSNGSMTVGNQTEGPLGGAISFDGANQYLDRGSSSSLNNITDAITLSAWVKVNSFINNSYEGLIWKLNGSDPSQATSYALTLGWNNQALKFCASTSGGYGRGRDGNTALNPGVWYYAVGTYDSATHIVNLYLNGNLDSTSNSAITGTILPVNSMTRIGKGAQSPINGTVDEARISSVVRSADWIKAEYNNQASPEEFLAYATGEEPVSQANYSLIITQGSGSGYYQQNAAISITANPPASGKVFDAWIGDTQYLSDPSSTTTTVTMPNKPIALTATYKNLPSSSGGGGSSSSGGGGSVSVSPTILKTEIKSIAANNVVLNLSVNNATQMMLSDSSSFAGSSWVAYTSNPTYLKKDTQSTLYLKFKSSTGITSSTVTLNIPTDTNNIPPAFSITGSSSDSQTVTITASPSAVIHYTLDGTTPTVSSPVYTAPLTIDKTTTLKAIAIKTGYPTTSVSSGTYTINPSSINPTAYPTGTLLKLSFSPRVYVVIQNKKKWISTPEVFEQLGYKWTNIQTISETTLKQYPDYEDNLIRQNNDYKVYLVVNGVKRHIPNPQIFIDYGFLWTDVVDTDQQTIDKYKDTYLIKESGKDGIYYVNQQGVRKLIPTTDIFNSYGDKQSDVQIVSKLEMESYQLSNLIRLNNNPEVYLIQGNIKKHIPSVTVANKYKLNLNQVMSVNQQEFNYYQSGGELK
jgi:hypothetical protein